MGWWDDWLPVVGSIGGAGIGSLFGQPMLGASIGGKIGQVGAGLGDSIDGGSPDPERKAAEMTAGYDRLLGELPTYQGLPPGQGLMAQDKAAMEQARRHAAGFAQGREGALEQEDAASSGGASRSGKLLGARQQASQAAADRLSGFDLGEAGIASERDLQNRAMLNEFNQRNMMNKIAIQGGKTGALQNQQMLGMMSRYGRQADQGNLFSNLGALGMRFLNQGKNNNTSTNGDANITGNDPGDYWKYLESAGNNGV